MTEDDALRDFVTALPGEIGLRQAREQSILASYERLSTRDLMSGLLVEYRCHTKKNCLLFRCWRTPAGDVYHLPAYKLEARRNAAASNDSGRIANTTDGLRRWRAQAGDVDTLRAWPPTAPFELHCDHVQPVVLVSLVIADVDRATPGKDPTRRTSYDHSWP